MWFEVVIVEDSGVSYEDRTAKIVISVVTCNLSIDE
jgi:hypothetical protein